MNTDIQFYLELLKKRLPVMVVIFTLCAGLGIGLAVTMPPKFKAEASLLVEGAQIPDELVISTVQTQAAEELLIIEQRLMTRDNLIDIASKFRVFAGESGMTPDDVVAEMRELTEVSLTTGRDEATIMRIAFTSGDPAMSANVVNEFVTLVLRADAERRTGESGKTLEFFEQRVERLTNELAKQSAEIVAFKEANKDALPEGLEYRLDRQSTLQERLNLAARDRVSLGDQRNRLIAVGSATGVALSPQQQQLLELEAELRWKLSVFSDNNPKVRVLRSRIEQLKANLPSAGEDDQTSTTTNSILDLQLQEIDSRIAALDEEKRITEAELEVLREAIERTPQVSIQLEKLEREYENTQSLYNQAVASRATAEQGVDVEVSAKGERVAVVEQASVPTSPTSPNRKLVAGGGVFVGTALAALFFTLTELLNRTIRRPADLVRGLGVQPLATLPYLEEESVRRRRRMAKTVFVVAALIAIPVAFWALHTFYMPLDLLFETIILRVGI